MGFIFAVGPVGGLLDALAASSVARGVGLGVALLVSSALSGLGFLITFDISKKGDNTEVRFTHMGLVPEYECFGNCSSAWGFYINRSLRNLITTGKGQPNPTEEAGEERAG